jgi:hypothetical protein
MRDNGIHSKEMGMKSRERIMQTEKYEDFHAVKNVACQQQNLYCDPFMNKQEFVCQK